MWRRILQVPEAAPRLATLAAGVLGEGASLAEGWRVFRRFVAEPVKCAEDRIVVYVGTLPKDASTYAVRLGRVFEVNDDDKYDDHTEGVMLAFTTPADAARDTERLSRMSASPDDWGALLDGVERDPAFVAALARGPWRCTIGPW